MIYKEKLARSNTDIATKAVTAAHNAIMAKMATPGATVQAEKEAWEAAIIMLKAEMEEKESAVTALRDAIDASFRDRDDAIAEWDASMAQMKAVLTEARTLIGGPESTTENQDVTAELKAIQTASEEITPEFSALMKRFEMAGLKTDAAMVETKAAIDVTDMLLNKGRG